MEAFKAPILHFNCILSRCHFVYGELRDVVLVERVSGCLNGGHRPGVLSAAADVAKAGSSDVALWFSNLGLQNKEAETLWADGSPADLLSFAFHLMLCRGQLAEDGLFLYLAWEM